MLELRTLKHKSRIYVEAGAILYGIMDETNTLKEGEVFITPDTKEGRHRVIVSDHIVITRAPALHPGDIEAIEIYQVSHQVGTWTAICSMSYGMMPVTQRYYILQHIIPDK